jgi:hypothetical protein
MDIETARGYIGDGNSWRVFTALFSRDVSESVKGYIYDHLSIEDEDVEELLFFNKLAQAEVEAIEDTPDRRKNIEVLVDLLYEFHQVCEVSNLADYQQEYSTLRDLLVCLMEAKDKYSYEGSDLKGVHEYLSAPIKDFMCGMPSINGIKDEINDDAPLYVKNAYKDHRDMLDQIYCRLGYYQNPRYLVETVISAWKVSQEQIREAIDKALSDNLNLLLADL